MMLIDKVFLASKSPRRLELLRFCFENVEQIQCLREEPKWEIKETAEHYLKRCIEVKSLGAKEALELRMKTASSDEGSLLVAADTIVVLDGEIFGKPESSVGAVKMLSRMMGREHQVMTAYSVALFQGSEEKEAHTALLKTRVRFRKAPLAEIKAYVKTGDSLDKSGSYGVQGPAMQFVEKVDGSYQSVMGLPLFEIQKITQAWKKNYS
ncbi:MAG: Maf family protein [Bdellovibrionota bacterium]